MKTVVVKGKSVTPSKVVCVGKNYVEHIAEMDSEVPDEMVIFNKPNSAIGDALFAVKDEPLHYEAEIAFMVEGGEFAAVAVGLDLTKRQTQSKLKKAGLPWERAKAFDGAALFSEFVDLPDALEQLTVKLDIDGVTTQHGGVELMIYKPAQILAGIKAFLTLEDGDIVMTGTPKGVGAVQAGANYSASILNGEQLVVAQQWLAK